MEIVRPFEHRQMRKVERLLAEQHAVDAHRAVTVAGIPPPCSCWLVFLLLRLYSPKNRVAASARHPFFVIPEVAMGGVVLVAGWGFSEQKPGRSSLWAWGLVVRFLRSPVAGHPFAAAGRGMECYGRSQAGSISTGDSLRGGTHKAASRP